MNFNTIVNRNKQVKAHKVGPGFRKIVVPSRKKMNLKYGKDKDYCIRMSDKWIRVRERKTYFESRNTFVWEQSSPGSQLLSQILRVTETPITLLQRTCIFLFAQINN